MSMDTPGGLRPLFEEIVKRPPPRARSTVCCRSVANLDSSDYLGRIAVGRIFNGRVKIAIRSPCAS